MKGVSTAVCSADTKLCLQLLFYNWYGRDPLGVKSIKSPYKKCIETEGVGNLKRTGSQIPF